MRVVWEVKEARVRERGEGSRCGKVSDDKQGVKDEAGVRVKPSGVCVW